MKTYKLGSNIVNICRVVEPKSLEDYTLHLFVISPNGRDIAVEFVREGNKITYALPAYKQCKGTYSLRLELIKDELKQIREFNNIFEII